MDDARQQGVMLQAAEEALRFRAQVPDAKQRPQVSYSEALSAFEEEMPETGAEPEDVIARLITCATPGLQTSTGPRFFGWVMGGSHPVGVAADWLTSAWGQNAWNHAAAPSAAAAETVAARWLLDVLRLPPETSVGFVTGATIANFVCLSAARLTVLRRAGWDVAEKGVFGAPPITLLIGDDAHPTVYAVLQFLGFGTANVRRVMTDEAGAMKLEAFSAALTDCDGPLIVVTQAGQMNTGAFDRHETICALAHARGAWVHVDGAFGLWARACPDRQHLAVGIEQADSWATDGHKWLQTPFDSGYAFVRDAEAHRRAMTIAPGYLPPVEDKDRDPGHYVPELSRRARGFPTWAMLRHLGRTGIAEMVERHCRLSRLFAERLGEVPGITIMNEVVLNQTIVRFGDEHSTGVADDLTRRVVERLQQDGTCFLGGAGWKGKWVMRISVIGWATTEEDVSRTINAIIRVWREIKAEP